ncbi:MAG: mechanosensitive ion channel family protein [Chloroflexota bacterium]|jgi:small conductance mechanosensitive channel
MDISDITNEFLLLIGLRILLAALVLLVGAFLARFGRNAANRVVNRLNLTPSLREFFVRITFFGIWAMMIFLALAMIGVPMTSLVAAVGAISVVLGLALQQTLQDVAAAVIFLLFRPFEPGDVIRAGTYSGRVQEIQPFSTTLIQGDGQIVFVPNSEIRRAGIYNLTKSGILRADMIFRLNVTEDIQRARILIEGVMKGDSRVLDQPAPVVVVDDLTETGVIISARPFVVADDLFQVRWDLREQIQERLNEEGIQMVALQSVMNPGQPAAR